MDLHIVYHRRIAFSVNGGNERVCMKRRDQHAPLLPLMGPLGGHRSWPMDDTWQLGMIARAKQRCVIPDKGMWALRGALVRIYIPIRIANGQISTKGSFATRWQVQAQSGICSTPQCRHCSDRAGTSAVAKFSS